MAAIIPTAWFLHTNLDKLLLRSIVWLLKITLFTIHCPVGHSGCPANMQYMEPHSEKKMPNATTEELSNEDILVRTLTAMQKLTLECIISMRNLTV
ncbi:hypothetical protein MAR_002172, partial [Mya arenaria]